MAEMEVGRGRIHPEFYSERPVERDLRRELRGRDNLDGAVRQRSRLLVRLNFARGRFLQFASPISV
jgi:hypothetical protein